MSETKYPPLRTLQSNVEKSPGRKDSSLKCPQWTLQRYKVPLTERVGSPDWIRTSYLVLRRHALYPNELRDHFDCIPARTRIFLRRQMVTRRNSFICSEEVSDFVP